MLTRAGVRIFFDDEVEARGIDACMREARARAAAASSGRFGMSVDLDAFRVRDSPAVGTPEAGGIIAAEFLEHIRDFPFYDELLATEIVEFMPHRDDFWRRSERLVFDLIEAIYLPRVAGVVGAQNTFARTLESEPIEQQRVARRVSSAQ